MLTFQASPLPPDEGEPEEGEGAGTGAGERGVGAEVEVVDGLRSRNINEEAR